MPEPRPVVSFALWLGCVIVAAALTAALVGMRVARGGM